MRTQTICFTGHRTLPASKLPALRQKLKQALTDYIAQGYCYFLAGGALGFDTLAAQTVLELKESYPQIRLFLAIPCLSQPDAWPEADKAEYERIRAAASKIVYTSVAYTSGCMYRRNRYLVDNSSLCLCYLTRFKGGTAYTVRYAMDNNVPVVNLAMGL